MQEWTSDGIARILLEHYGLTCEKISEMESEWGGTFRITTGENEAYLLKIAPDTVPVGRTEMEVDALSFLERKKLDIDLPRIVNSVEGSTLVRAKQGVVRLYHWLPGRLWHEVNPVSESLLRELGAKLAALSNALSDFSHDHADGSFKWMPHNVEWIGDALAHLGDDRSDLLRTVIGAFRRDTKPLLKDLPQQVTYNDANDHNILVSEQNGIPGVSGFIDFGDLETGPRVSDLAVCAAYVAMPFPDPVGAICRVVEGFHSIVQLEEIELEVLFNLIRARLAISIASSAQRAAIDPDNTYWQVSDRGATDLLRKLNRYSSHLALCRFRNACGLEPSPRAAAVREYLRTHRNKFHPLIGRDLADERVVVFDWSVGSTDMGTFEDIANVRESTHKCFERMRIAKACAGIGRYNEPRAVYTTEEYAVPGNRGKEMRTIHIGIDIFMEPGSPLYAPLDGEVYAIVNNEGDKEYGPLLILRHVENDLEFFTLYGHNDLDTLDLWKPGDEVRSGDIIAYIGDYPVNGNWVPHSHFQVITHMLDYTDDYPGVVLASQREVWLSLCPDPNLILGISHPEMEVVEPATDILETKRRHLLGPNLSYVPIHFVRGWNTHLYTVDGTAYLDTRNNIAHVGHEHPRVIEAGARQMAVLNTNTRYLHDLRTSLAERLLGTLPDNIDTLYLVNSGSEANDLALRIARNYLNSRQTLTMWQGYVGHTEACIDVSPYKFAGPGGPGKKDFVHVLPHPKQGVACSVKAALAAAEQSGALTFIHESLPGCAGQVIPPPGYFAELYRAVRASGGICIADEVQTGIGRTGGAFWAFELYAVEPDIVTIGKPLGNGHPVAAVAVSRELADVFDNGMEYFNSFGGNPVSCAIAQAVLDVVEREGLQQKARDVGVLWREELGQIASHSEVIADIRGCGLYMGVEFAEPSGAPLSGVARYISDRMLDYRILTSLDGPHENVMKIKPPMSIDADEIDSFNRVLEKILSEDAVLRHLR